MEGLEHVEGLQQLEKARRIRSPHDNDNFYYVVRSQKAPSLIAKLSRRQLLVFQEYLLLNILPRKT